MKNRFDYDRMRRTLGILATARWKIGADDPIHPVAVLDELAERSSASARKGLRMAINDLVEELADASPNEIEQLDAELIAANGATVGEIRAQFSKRLRAILKRGIIRDEQEYYLVRNAVEFTDAEMAPTIWSLLLAFETKAEN